MNSPIDPAIVMPDVQSATDTRHIPIQRVGIRGVRHPMLVQSGDGSAQGTVASWTLTVAPADQQGASATVSGSLKLTGGAAVRRDHVGSDGIGDLLTLTSQGALSFQRGDGSGKFSTKTSA